MTINELNELVVNAFNTAAGIIDQLPQGQKIKTSDLAQMVGNQMGIDGETLTPLMNFFAHKYENAGIATGRSGGVYHKITQQI